MSQCESKIGSVCARPATWNQTIYAGPRDQGRVLMLSAWCDEHADRIVQKRRRESLDPPQMTRLAPEVVSAGPTLAVASPILPSGDGEAHA